MGQKKHKPCNGTGYTDVPGDAMNGEPPRSEPCTGCEGTGRVSSGAKRGEL